MKSLIATVLVGAALRPRKRAAHIQIRHDAAKHQFAVTVGGKPFTTHCHGEDFLDKPVFYPVMSPNGARQSGISDGREGAGRVLHHPHHQSPFSRMTRSTAPISEPDVPAGASSNAACPPPETSCLDLIRLDKDGQALEETKNVTFAGSGQLLMDHDSTPKATRVPVSMGDTKEGVRPR
jgi:hypothetical protein